MGMFDTVNFKCPRCDEIISEQSKADECLLRDYSFDEVPVNIAHDIVGENIYCPNCSREYVIVIPNKISSVFMGIVEV